MSVFLRTQLWPGALNSRSGTRAADISPPSDAIEPLRIAGSRIGESEDTTVTSRQRQRFPIPLAQRRHIFQSIDPAGLTGNGNAEAVRGERRVPGNSPEPRRSVADKCEVIPSRGNAPDILQTCWNRRCRAPARHRTVGLHG